MYDPNKLYSCVCKSEQNILLFKLTKGGCSLAIRTSYKILLKKKEIPLHSDGLVKLGLFYRVGKLNNWSYRMIQVEQLISLYTFGKMLPWIEKTGLRANGGNKKLSMCIRSDSAYLKVSKISSKHYLSCSSSELCFSQIWIIVDYNLCRFSIPVTHLTLLLYCSTSI